MTTDFNKFSDSELDESKIPSGPYCYGRKLYTKTDQQALESRCPYWDRDPDQDEQESGYCHFMKTGDWLPHGTSLLWDQCKECGINWR